MSSADLREATPVGFSPGLSSPGQSLQECGVLSKTEHCSEFKAVFKENTQLMAHGRFAQILGSAADSSADIPLQGTGSNK